MEVEDVDFVSLELFEALFSVLEYSRLGAARSKPSCTMSAGDCAT